MREGLTNSQRERKREGEREKERHSERGNSPEWRDARPEHEAARAVSRGRRL